MSTGSVPTSLDVGNIIFLEHVNVCIPDQQLATLFYIVGLGLTRDPYMRVGIDNMGINIGRSQFHLPTTGSAASNGTREAQRVRGIVGLVFRDLSELTKRLEQVTKQLAGTRFRFEKRADYVEVMCPWGNRLRCHAPSAEFGDTDLALAYVEFDVPRKSAQEIARFYGEIFSARATLERDKNGAVARIDIGIAQKLRFRETDAPLPPFDGHHIQIYVADYSHSYQALAERGLITEDSIPFQFRFSKIVDLEKGGLLFEVEHEVRSLKHPGYNRPLINRNPNQTNNHRERNLDAFRGSY